MILEQPNLRHPLPRKEITTMSVMKPFLTSLLTLFVVGPLGLGAEMPVILDMKARAALRDQWLEIRLETVVPL